jgi:hypothetical protein
MGYILKLFRNKQYCLITGNIIEIELADEISATEPTKIYSLSEKMGIKLQIVREETTIYIVEV